jgi:ABC-type Fe3+/spermidine/putrescine transport system ATPase subunit
MTDPAKAQVPTSKLVLSDLTCIFGKQIAVDRCNLSIGTGEFLSLLGPSGCGKTTTLRMIAGFIRPSGGRIVMDGRELSSPGMHLPPEARQMSMIFQSYAIWPHMTVAQNVGFGLRIRKMSREVIREKVAQALAMVRLEALGERYPSQLSGGQQQRVALARAIVVRPSVLLLDEPLSNLDANLREEMRFEIRRLHDEFRMTTIYVTHDQSEAMVMSDRVAVLNAGRLEQIASPQALYRRPATRFVASFIGKTNLVDAQLAGNDVVIAGTSVPRAKLALDGWPRTGSITFSLRPEHVQVRPGEVSASVENVIVAAELTSRSFVGESWDMTATANDGTRLRLAVASDREFAVGDRLLLEIRPDNLVAVQ